MRRQITPRPARRGSTLVQLCRRPRPIHPKAAARMMRAAERNPALDLEATALLRALLMDCATWRTGQCTPTFATLARRAKISRATVARRLPVLTGAGLVVCERRAVMVDQAAGWLGKAQWCQLPNAYHFNLPEAPPTWPDCESQAAPQVGPNKNFLPVTARAREAGPELEGALKRLGAAIAARERR